MYITNEEYINSTHSEENPKLIEIDDNIVTFLYDDISLYSVKCFEDFEKIEFIVFTTFKNIAKPDKGAKILKVELNFKTKDGKQISIFPKANERMVRRIYAAMTKSPNYEFKIEGPEKGLNLTAPVKFEFVDRMGPIFYIVFFLFFIVLTVGDYTDYIFGNITNFFNRLNPVIEQPLLIPRLQNYNNETQNSLLLRRKESVKKSVFNNNSYRPTDAVFGGIQDKTPWISLKNSICIDQKLDPSHVSKGPAALSRFIENPNVLIGIMPPYVMNINENSLNCTREPLKFIPSQMTYDKNHNTVTAYYPMSYEVMNQRVNKNRKSVPLYFTLTGLNARDLGYKFATVSDSDGVLFMNNGANISSDVIEFKDFIHVGSACGIPDGCNNLSPYQPALDFYFISIPAEITLKLWKDKPIAKFMPADFSYKIIFNIS